MKKLTEIQTELKVKKARNNSFGKYMYRSCEDILEAVKPLLSKHECNLHITDEIILIGDRFYVKSTAIFSDSDGNFTDATGLAREEQDKKGMDASQITGGASSYARKYALNGLFLIDDNKDPDDTVKVDVDVFMQSVSLCNTLEELTKLWDGSGTLKSNAKYREAISERRRVLDAKQSK